MVEYPIRPKYEVTPEQQAIRDKCFQLRGTFVEFPIEDFETSVPERFEKIVRMYPDRLAVKMGERSLTYDELNRYANRIARAILKKRRAVGRRGAASVAEETTPTNSRERHE